MFGKDLREKRKNMKNKVISSSLYIHYEYISYFLFSHKLSDEQFCIECQISLDTLHKIKYNNFDFRFKDLVNICEYMDISLETLVTDLDYKRKWNEPVDSKKL